MFLLVCDCDNDVMVVVRSLCLLNDNVIAWYKFDDATISIYFYIAAENQQL